MLCPLSCLIPFFFKSYPVFDFAFHETCTIWPPPRSDVSRLQQFVWLPARHICQRPLPIFKTIPPWMYLARSWQAEEEIKEVEGRKGSNGGRRCGSSSSGFIEAHCGIRCCKLKIRSHQYYCIMDQITMCIVKGFVCGDRELLPDSAGPLSSMGCSSSFW